MTDPLFIKFPVTSFDGFLQQIQTFDLQERNEERFLVLFRGQRKDKPLLPTIARHSFSKKDFIEREKKLMDEFRRLSYPHIDRSSLANDWDLLALAQHHTLPTRLLDWTSNPLAALWFAFEKGPEGKHDRVVWAFSFKESEIVDTSQGSPFDDGKTKAFRPNHITKTITAQSGWFTVHKIPKKSGRFIPLETNSLYTSRLAKFTIPGKQRKAILARLDRLGVNHYSLFPDIYGVSRYLTWKSL